MRGAKRLPAWCIVIAGMVHSDYMHGCIVETGMARKGHPEKRVIKIIIEPTSMLLQMCGHGAHT